MLEGIYREGKMYRRRCSHTLKVICTIFSSGTYVKELNKLFNKSFSMLPLIMTLSERFPLIKGLFLSLKPTQPNRPNQVLRSIQDF